MSYNLKQCSLRWENIFTTAWIPACYANQGSKILINDEPWIVMGVSETSVPLRQAEKKSNEQQVFRSIGQSTSNLAEKYDRYDNPDWMLYD